MKLKCFALVLGLSTLSFAQAAQRNVCDDMIEAGTFSAEQIKSCQDEQGVSDYFKEQEKKKKNQEETDQSESATEAKKKANLEFKTFTNVSKYGVPFIAFKIDPRFYPPKEKRVTEGDALCTYLGYEKAIKSSVSSDMAPKDADNNGFIIDTSLFGSVSKKPEMYHDEDLKFYARKYVDITCVRRKDKNMEDSDDVYKKLTEDLLILPPEINGAKKDTTSGINNGPRTGKEVNTPNGYKPPEWANEAPASNTSK
ncbi:MAG: hypothetical protein ACXVLQ_02385 [Bacteriovorax sp.]